MWPTYRKISLSFFLSVAATYLRCCYICNHVKLFEGLHFVLVPETMGLTHTGVRKSNLKCQGIYALNDQ
jgi:hypothetical protein